MNFSYWEHKHLLADIEYLIVGMGLVGLQTAILLKEKNPKAKIVVIDRFAWSMGASTRNAGFACFANMSEILDDLETDSPENVYATIGKRYRGLQKLRKRFSDVLIGYEEIGSTEIFTTQNKEYLSNGIDSLQGINTILYNELGLDRVFTFKSNNPLPNVRGSIYNRFEGQLHTGKLYTAVYEYATQLGVKLYGGLEVIDWTSGSNIVVSTSQELEIQTKNLILCTNAFTSKITSEEVIPCRGQVIVSEPLDQLPCEGPHFYDSGYYYWRNVENRILLGGARNVDFEGELSIDLITNEKVNSELRRFMNENICGREVDIEYQWSGIMGMGSNTEKTPIIKELESNVIAAVRLGGMGVALSAEIAEEVVKMT